MSHYCCFLLLSEFLRYGATCLHYHAWQVVEVVGLWYPLSILSPWRIVPFMHSGFCKERSVEIVTCATALLLLHIFNSRKPLETPWKPLETPWKPLDTFWKPLTTKAYHDPEVMLHQTLHSS